MVKLCRKAGLGVGGVGAIRFVQIATGAGEGQIFWRGAAAAGTREDVLKMKRGSLTAC